MYPTPFSIHDALLSPFTKVAVPQLALESRSTTALAGIETSAASSQNTDKVFEKIHIAYSP
jgi:hypothetical protein